MKAVKEEIEEDEGDNDYKPQLLASAKQPMTSKVEQDQDNVAAINSSQISLHEEPDVPPERGQTETFKDQAAVQQQMRDYNTQKNYIRDADPDTDLLANENLDDMINPILYMRGVPTDSFYLILTGKVMICSGNEGFFLEQGAFNYMGVECLTNDNYVPDFSAKIIGKAKLLKIKREDYKRSMININNLDNKIFQTKAKKKY